ncbi:MAG: DNA polymerase III subunit delta [Sphingomonas sp.]|nr:DNA polymerase III subunit delta [Sphingomonas sp.]
MKANATQLRAAIDKGNAAIRLFVLHGPDESGAREWAARLGRRLGPDAERIDVEGSGLRADPSRLATEAASLSLFGDQRYILVNNAGEDSVEAVTLLLGAQQAVNPVVMIAPMAKASGKLVKLAIASPAAMVHGCYQPVGEEANALATMIAAEHGLRANAMIAARLVASSGGDRAVLTREIEKLALYQDAAPDRPKTLDDAAMDAVGADLGDAEIAAAVEAAIDGRAADLGSELARLAIAGTSPIPLLRMMVRRLMLIAELAGEVADGRSINDAIERHNIFFREKASTARALRYWSPGRLTDAIDHLRRTERSLMASASAGNVLADQASIAVARVAARRR